MSVTTSVSFEHCPYWPPDPMSVSTVQKIGNVLEVTTSRSPPPNLSRYRRLSSNTYLDRNTGEVCAYHSRDKPTQRSINRAFKKLYRLICANFEGSKGIMLTLTVTSELSASPSDLYSYYSKFWRKLKRHFPSLEYLAVIEPHQSGRFHYHVLLKSNKGSMPKVPAEFTGCCWMVGRVHSTKIYDVEGLARYLTGKKKRLAWLQYHSSKTRLWRSSKGIVRPVSKTMNRGELESYVKNNSFHFSGGDRIKVIHNNSTLANIITHERFVRG